MRRGYVKRKLHTPFDTDATNECVLLRSSVLGYTSIDKYQRTVVDNEAIVEKLFVTTELIQN